MGFFGAMLALSAAEATYIFIALLMFILVFKAGLHILEVYCERNGFRELLENLYREFMIMGLISFGVFVSNEAYDYESSSMYNTFHFAHMLILFIGLTFILQAILLIAMVASRKGTLLRFSLISSSQLLDEYHTLMSSNNFQSLLFRNGPLSISFPELREKIENRILKDFFIRSFNLPEEFNFAIYTCRALKSYVISLSEVRPLNWFILAVFAAINYGKVRVIDERLKPLHCFIDDRSYDTNAARSSRALSSFKQHGSAQEIVNGSEFISNRLLASKVVYSEETLCREYFLSYSVFCAFMLTLFLTSLLIVSEVYMRRLLGKVLDMEIDLEWQEVEEVEEEEAAIEYEQQAAVYNLQLLEKERELEIEVEKEKEREREREKKMEKEKEKEKEREKEKEMKEDDADSSPVLSTFDRSVHSTPITFTLDTPNEVEEDSFEPILSPHIPHTFSSSTPDSAITQHTECPTVFSLQDPSTCPSLPFLFGTVTPQASPRSLDHIPSPSKYRAAGGSILNRARTNSIQGMAGLDGRIPPYKSRIHGLDRARSASMSRGRAATMSLGSVDGNARTHSNPHGYVHTDQAQQGKRVRSLSTISPRGSINFGANSEPLFLPPPLRLPPDSVIEEHQQQMKEIGRARANTFIQYMADSLPVTLLSSRFLYQKCLERICRAEDNRYLRNSRATPDQISTSPTTAHNSITEKSLPEKTILENFTEKSKAVFLNSGKEGYERNPLFSSTEKETNLHGFKLLPINRHTEPVSDNRQRSLSVIDTATFNPTMSDSGSISVRDSIRERGGVGVGVSPRQNLGACRQRSFTAENILLRASFQSQTRSLRVSPRDASGSYVHSPSRIPSTSNSADRGDALQLQHDVEIQGQLGDQLQLEAGLLTNNTVPIPLDSTPRMQMWPTAEPEILPTPPMIMDKNSNANNNGRGKYESNERMDEENEKNRAIINSITSVSGVGSKVPTISDNNSTPEDSKFVPKGRMKRAYSDIFFQMAPPENLQPHQLQKTLILTQSDNKMNITERIGFDEKYTLYNPNNYKSEEKKCSTICSEIAWKILRKIGSLFHCFLYGLYAILVFGPTIHHTKEDEEEELEDEARIALQKDLSTIFLFGNSDLYYRAIEFSLLLQCVYIALWCTNFAIVAVGAKESTKWELFLMLPIPLNFCLLKLILNFACVLRSASVLDEDISAKICEDALDERVVTQRMRKMVRAALAEIDPLKASWSPFLKEVFSHYVPDGKPGVTPKQFTLFLHGIQIHISKKSIRRIFKVIDFDQSGYVTYEELSSIVFPELELHGTAPMDKKSRTDNSFVRTQESACALDNLPTQDVNYSTSVSGNSIHGGQELHHTEVTSGLSRVQSDMSYESSSSSNNNNNNNNLKNSNSGSTLTKSPKPSDRISTGDTGSRDSWDSQNSRLREVSFSPKRDHVFVAETHSDRAVIMSDSRDRGSAFQTPHTHAHVHTNVHTQNDRPFHERVVTFQDEKNVPSYLACYSDVGSSACEKESEEDRDEVDTPISPSIDSDREDNKINHLEKIDEGEEEEDQD